MKAAVAAGSADTADAAVAVLRAGGNAFDAAIAAGFAAAVAEPCLTSLAGGGFLLARTSTGDEVAYDFFVDAPGLARTSPPPPIEEITVRFGPADQRFLVGPGTVAVPGILPGYLAVHADLGRVPLDAVLAPAIHLAEHGVTVGRAFARLIALLESSLTLSAEGRALFQRRGRLLVTGDTFRNEPLGAFLRQVASGERRSFHHDELGGGITARDVSSFQVHRREPVRFRRGGCDVITVPWPSLGGHLVAFGASLLGPDPDLVAVAGALEAMTEERERLVGISATGTTQVSVTDHDGNVASLTTSNGSGSGIFAPGTGTQLNNMLGEDDLVPGGPGTLTPGARLPSMMAPTVVVRPDGTVVALGSGGSERIRSTVLQLVLGVTDHPERSLRDSVLAPRLHWDGSVLHAEPGLAHGALAELRQRRPVTVWPEPDLYFGGAHCAATDGQAVGDLRRQGVGLVLDP